jgi:hypothetical protein
MLMILKRLSSYTNNSACPKSIRHAFIFAYHGCDLHSSGTKLANAMILQTSDGIYHIVQSYIDVSLGVIYEGQTSS